MIRAEDVIDDLPPGKIVRDENGKAWRFIKFIKRRDGRVAFFQSLGATYFNAVTKRRSFQSKKLVHYETVIKWFPELRVKNENTPPDNG